ncbi:MAG: S8 family serine peptidase, partial [Acidiferrobacterales bacterium]|nr:S8 family serine peptidase [Acidiferrobacterales bacterium]
MDAPINLLKWLLVTMVATACFTNSSLLSASDQKLFRLIGLTPGGLKVNEQLSQPITIAIVDDGFNPNHQSLLPFSTPSKSEISNNLTDDDDNGYVDDIVGYDVSDNDGDVSPARGRLEDFYHGTFSASIIAKLLKAKLGHMDAYPIRFLYVKAVSDYSESLRLDSAYKGIQYALDQGADVISNSWSGGSPREVDTSVLSNAIRANTFMLNTVGNFQVTEPVLPANHPAVFGVGGTDFQGVLDPLANFGVEVDILAPAVSLQGATVSSNDGFRSGEGTSVAAPMVAATAGLMKLVNPAISVTEIAGCLHNTAISVEHRNPMIAGKIGAGMLQVDAAIKCAQQPNLNFLETFRANTRGTVSIDSTRLDHETNTHEWLIKPAGAYAAIKLKNSVSGDLEGIGIEIYNAETPEPTLPLWQGMLSALPSELQIEKSAVRIRLRGIQEKDFAFSSRYVFDPIDFEKRYCSGRVTLRKDAEIRDGSDESRYANRSDCQWLLKHRPGYDIQIQFIEFDLEQKDSVYLYGGDQAVQRNLFATFSGRTDPQIVSVEGGDALLWFLSDYAGRGNGF